ncbi:hypothetical protein [Actinoplanes sp. NPDC049681]|uniref:hypothetical protein n=1 Tax=Actinoplanes sp. NPDC049681 TaxID=3363905 RepID=UPI0037B37C0A
MRRLYGFAAQALRQMPDPARTVVRQRLQRTNRSLPGRRIDWGNIARHAPFSEDYGWDRGLPIDRYYIERFLTRRAKRIRGSVLEVQSPMYASRLGHAERITILDVEAGNPRADLIADLDEPGSVPVAAFDCVILTQVLQYTDPLVALRNVGDSLRPRGCALITVPAISPVDTDGLRSDRWRWTPEGLRRAIHDAGLTATVEGCGDALSAVAFILGIAAEEMPPGRLDRQDSRYPIVTCAVVEAAG